MSALAEVHPMFLDDAGARDVDIQFDQSQFQAVTPYSDDLTDEYEKAQEQLRQLRQQEEQIRQQAEELEELSRREDEFKLSNEQVTHKLEMYIAMLDRESAEAQQLADDCNEAHEVFESHLTSLSMLRPETWSRADRKGELARAMTQIEAAEASIDRNIELLQDVGAEKRTGIGRFFKNGSSSHHHHAPPAMGEAIRGSGSFGYWLKSGFAFSLPLMGFVGIGYALLKFL